MTRDELIAALERAEEPDSELDARIFVLLNPSYTVWGALNDGCPSYTRSIDSALKLVPEECAWQVGCEIDFTPIARVWGHDTYEDAWAATPAIALCIASLKARGEP